MTDRFLRLPEVMERTTLSRRSIYRRMGEGTFPRSVPLGENSVAWRESEIAEWMQAPMQWCGQGVSMGVSTPSNCYETPK